MDNIQIMNTRELAQKIRLDAINMVNTGKSSHIGSVLSVADILAVLYGSVMTHDPELPTKADRDRFILSKGHAGAGVYAALAETGYISKKILAQHCQNNSPLSGHVSHLGIPGVELSTGSLGHGLPVGAGMAYAARIQFAKHRIFVLLSDGECDEGSNWEAILFSSHHKLDNLTVIIDYNKLQSMKSTQQTLGLEPFSDKWVSFGWSVLEVDGHNHSLLEKALHSDATIPGKPTCIIAHTTKGKGVSYMENSVAWHYKTPLDEDYKMALAELKP